MSYGKFKAFVEELTISPVFSLESLLRKVLSLLLEDETRNYE